MLPGRESRAPSRRRHSACSTPARRTAASARQPSSTSSAKPPRRAARRSSYDRRCARLPADEVARRVASGMPFVVRFRMPEGETSWNDLVHGPITFPNKDIGEGDFIILRSDGTPIYNLAVVSDDIAMGITLVMRGDDHISNTPKQILLYEALGAALPQFAHLPMIHGLGREEAEQATRRDGRRRLPAHGHPAAGDAQLPRAARLVARQRHRGDDGAADDRAASRSTDCRRTPRCSITKKLEWMNGQHLSLMSAAELAPLVTRGDRRGRTRRRRPSSRRGSDWYFGLIDLLKVRARTIDDIVRQAMPYLRDDDRVRCRRGREDSGRTARRRARFLHATRDALAASRELGGGSHSRTRLRALAESRGVGAGKIFQPLRVALTGVRRARESSTCWSCSDASARWHASTRQCAFSAETS